MSDVAFRRLTPVIVVEAIEPVLPFWARLGVSPGVTVPHGDGLGFAILSCGSAEVMYQTLASVRADVGDAADASAYRGSTQQAYLFIEVESLESVERALSGERVFLPRRQTFYGSTETGYVDPAGNLVVFAQFPPRE